MKICHTQKSPVGVVHRRDVQHIDHLLKRREITCNEPNEPAAKPKSGRSSAGVYAMIAAAGLLTTFVAWAGMSR